VSTYWYVSDTNRLLIHSVRLSLQGECADPPFSSLLFYNLQRLFTRLPDLVSDELSEAESRPIYAKVNDFVRFLHKNHGTMLAQPFRKMNDAEMKEKKRLLKIEERQKCKAAGEVAPMSAKGCEKDIQAVEE